MSRHIFLCLLLLVFCTSYAQQMHRRMLKLMGCKFEIVVVADNKDKGDLYLSKAIDEIVRIEKLISSWDNASQTSLINQNAGVRPVKVDKELFDLIQRSKAISKLSDGAFDISYTPMDYLWSFDKSINRLPTKEEIQQSVTKVGFQNIILDVDKLTVFLKKKGMSISFGAIGKGYAADKAKDFLRDMGVTAGIINASGDMNTWGVQPNGQHWQVAITNPMDKTKLYGTFPVKNGAVVTSGNYEKFIMLNQKRYAHIIDPRTGLPTSGILSVTVFAPRAELADALATAIFVMGVNVGLDRINQLPNVESIIIDENGNIHTSKNIEIETK